MNLMQVNKPQPKQKKDNMGQNLAIAAAGLGLLAATGGAAAVPAIGGALGLGAGGMATAGMLGAGGAIGGAGVQVYDMMRDKPKQQSLASGVGYSDSAVGRRMESMKNPVDDLMVAQAEIEKLGLPYEQKLEYLKPINQALEQYKTRYT